MRLSQAGLEAENEAMSTCRVSAACVFTLVAFAVLAGIPCRGAESPKPRTVVGSSGVTLTVEPLADEYFDKAVEVRFKYTVKNGLPDGTAVVTMLNTDSGVEIVKSVPILLTEGEHRALAVWGKGAQDGGRLPELDEKPGDSRKVDVDADIEALFGKDDTKPAAPLSDRSDELPDGLYIPQVTLKDAAGGVLAELRFSSDEVKHMTVSGKAARKIGGATMDAKVASMQAWLAELRSLEAKARAAGADTSLPHLMVVALSQTAQTDKTYVAAKRYNVVLENYHYASGQVPKIRRQFEDLIRDPKSGVSADIIPRPKGRMTVKNGYFYAGDKPVFMAGYCMFALWLDLETIRELGFNLIHVSTSPDCIFPESEAPSRKLRVADYNDGTKCGAVEFLDACERLGMKVDFGLTTGGLPAWFWKKHPEAYLPHQHGASVAGMISYDIENPDALKLIERFYDAALTEIAGHPALNSFWLANEPSIINMSPYSAELFREYLEAKYLTVEKLNRAWGTSHASFADVKIRWGQKFGGDTPAAGIDFWWFNLGRLTHHFEWLQQLVRKHDPEVPCEYKLNNLQMGWFCPSPNVDQEGVTDISQIAGMDSGHLPFAKPYYDWLRSLSPEKPVVNLEAKIGGARTKLDFWKGVLSLGLAGIDWWCWHPKDLFSEGMCKTVSLHEGALAIYNIQRLFPQVMAFHQFPRSPFAVLYPDPVLPRAGQYFQVHTPVVNALTAMGYALDYVTEKRVEAGRLDAYRIVVLPAADWIKNGTFRRVEAFVRNGGTAVAIGTLPAHDEMGLPRDLGWLKTPASAKPYFGDPTNGVVYACGKGKVFVIPAAARDLDTKALLSQLIEIARQELPPQPVMISPTSGSESRTIPWKNAQGKDVFLTYVLNDWPCEGGERALEPRYNVTMKEGVDLITGEKIDPARFATPAPGVRLIEWTPASK